MVAKKTVIILIVIAVILLVASFLISSSIDIGDSSQKNDLGYEDIPQGNPKASVNLQINPNAENVE